MEDGLKLYLGPDGSYRSIDTIPKGTALSEFGHNENNDTWLFTEYNGQYGWIRTANGVYQPDCFIPAEKLTYILNDNSLELYKNNQKSPKKYTVIEDKDNLEKLLSDNYCIKQLKKNID